MKDKDLNKIYSNGTGKSLNVEWTKISESLYINEWKSMSMKE